LRFKLGQRSLDLCGRQLHRTLPSARLGFFRRVALRVEVPIYPL
jgi:hypothetical protein